MRGGVRPSLTAAGRRQPAAVSFMLHRAWIWRTGQSFALKQRARSLVEPRSDFAWTPSDGSTRFAMSGVRSRVFLPCPPDAYAEPPGWLVWSLRSGRMAARVVYCLDAGLRAPGCKVAKLSVLGPHSRRDLIQQSYSTLRQIQRCKRLHCGANDPKIAAADRCCMALSARR